MKIRHGVIISIALFIALVILGQEYLPLDFRTEQILIDVIGILWLVSLGLIVYLIIRNIIRAIKGTAAGAPKQKQDTAPPWER